MKYFVSTPELDTQLTEIRSKIRLSMNGIVSDHMTKSGIQYKLNYGVSIPRIKELAAEYKKSHDLAQRLWNMEIRETMIMATLIEPVDKFTEKLADEWVACFKHTDIIEQTTMNLFSKLDFANKLCLKWVNNDNVWIKITGFILAARIYNKLSTVEINYLIESGISNSNTENLHLYKAIALCLSRFCRTNETIAQKIVAEIEPFSQNPGIAQQYILNEVKQENLFLENL